MNNNSLKITLISTIKNEEGSINSFISSMLKQSKKPDEIIIVDGGSTDNTIPIIEKFKQDGTNIKLIKKKNINIATGRNIAVNNSKYDLIAATDAGCKISPNWIQNITKPFQDRTVDVVAGWFEGIANSDLERNIIALTYPKLKRIEHNSQSFLPSSRSIAFKKTCWEQVGGYPEFLTFAGEDTLFDIKLKKKGFKFSFAKDAVVYWKPRSNLSSFAKQQYLYSKGNGEGRIKKHEFIKILSFYLLLLLFLFLSLYIHVLLLIPIFQLIIYWFFKIKKAKSKTSRLKQFFHLPLLTTIRDISYIFGYIVGSFSR